MRKCEKIGEKTNRSMNIRTRMLKKAFLKTVRKDIHQIIRSGHSGEEGRIKV